MENTVTRCVRKLFLQNKLFKIFHTRWPTPQQAVSALARVPLSVVVSFVLFSDCFFSSLAFHYR
jgi:hypothetical protein